jgi:hypothetical protein
MQIAFTDTQQFAVFEDLPLLGEVARVLGLAPENYPLSNQLPEGR